MVVVAKPVRLLCVRFVYEVVAENVRFAPVPLAVIAYTEVETFALVNTTTEPGPHGSPLLVLTPDEGPR